MKTLCPGKSKIIVVKDDRFPYSFSRMYNPFPELPVKRIRMKCLLCGRKVLSSVQVDHDGYEIYHFIPPHKTKGWWKKIKKKYRKEKI